MLAQLHIRNFAIIDQTEFELPAGMTALTGETGAGKSILLDALGLVLGDRADTESVREGTAKAEITADFIPESDDPIWQWLKEHDLDDEDSCILRRIVSKDNRSRGYINGSPVSLQMLKTAGEMLVNIHGQHAHQSLTQAKYQRDTLDNHSQNKPLLDKLYNAYKNWDAANNRYETIQAELDQRQQRIDMLEFQLQEFSALNIDADELLSIEKDHQRAANAGKLHNTAYSCFDSLYNDDNAIYSQLNRVESELINLTSMDENAQEHLELVQSAAIACNEAASGLKHYIDAIDSNPEKLQWYDQRLTELYTLAKKHRVNLEDLVDTANTLQAELDDLQSSDLTLESLDKQRLEQEAIYHKIAKQLSVKRQKSAKTMSKQISKSMQELAMKGGIFEVELTTSPSSRPNIHGMDEIQFLVSANPGQKIRPLGKVASGGELSRISLAIQLIASQHQAAKTLIFDEVDSGVGGAVAETVGMYLRKLTSKCQVLCVTHLPQVAAQAHNHYRVSKTTNGKQTKTQLTPLDKEETIEEIARMLGGKRITQQTRKNAIEMLANH